MFNHGILDITKVSDTEKLDILKSMRNKIINGKPTYCFDIAQKLVSDKNNNVRWQALIVLGEYIPSGIRNDDIWNIIENFCDTDEDMQNALATILLEHLLEYDYDSTCQKLQSVTSEKIDFIRNLISRCWSFSEYKLPDIRSI
jgi:hypothetical protein